MMLLSKPQKELLALLRQYGAVREDQAKRLLRQQYTELHFEPVVRQLVCSGLIRRENGYLSEPHGQPDADIIQALDIMLLLEPNRIERMQKGAGPFALTFFKQRQEKLWRYDICIAASGKEALLCAALEQIQHKYRMIVIVLDSSGQQDKFVVPCEHCYAWKENGKYKFYK